MKFAVKNSRRLDDEMPTPSSSINSTHSFDLFGAGYTESSDDVSYVEPSKDRQRSPRRHAKSFGSPLRSAVHFRIGDGSSSSGASMETVRTPLLDSRKNSDPEKQPRVAYLTLTGDQDGSSSSEQSIITEKRKQSSLVTIFAVWNTIMGSSLLTMAWGVERAGLGTALVLLMVMGALCLYTAYILLRVRVHHGLPSWEVHDLCRELLGRWSEVLAQGFSLIVMLGANIVYWILMTNFLYYTVNYFVELNTDNSTDTKNVTLLCPKGSEGRPNSTLIPTLPVPLPDESPYWGLHSTVPVLLAFIIFPLLNFKNATFFTKFNSLGTLSVAYLLVFVLAKGLVWGAHVVNWRAEFRVGRDAAVLSGMLALSFYIHNIIITIMEQNRRQENNGRDLTIAFVLVTLTYVLVGAVFYICFPLAKDCIEDNILNNFEKHDVMSVVARILLLFQVVTVYPLIAYMFRTQTLALLPLNNKNNTWAVTFLNLAIVVVCILFACFCPNIGTIVRYTGAVSGLVHIFTLPSLLQVRSLQLRGKLVWYKALFYLIITLLGAVNLFAQFFISE